MPPCTSIMRATFGPPKRPFRQLFVRLLGGSPSGLPWAPSKNWEKGDKQITHQTQANKTANTKTIKHWTTKNNKNAYKYRKHIKTIKNAKTNKDKNKQQPIKQITATQNTQKQGENNKEHKQIKLTTKTINNKNT